MKRRGHFKLGLRGTVVLSAVGLLGQLQGGTTQWKSADASIQTSQSFAAQVAERLFPSGTSTVVLVSGSAQGRSVDLVAAQALATRFNGALLITQDSGTLGVATSAALQQMQIPEVNPAPSTDPQPFQATAGAPTLYLVGAPGSFSSSLVTSLESHYQVNMLTSPSPASLLSQAMSIAVPPMPSGPDATAFPSQWTGYGGSQSHNSGFDAPANSPAWVTTGVSWKFAEAAAVPLQGAFPDLQQLGARSAPVKMTQNLGNAVGVTAVGGVIYAESDDYHLYAIDAHSGKQIWESQSLVNALMGNPVIANGMIYVTAGDTGFPFSQLLKFYLNKGNYALTRGLMYSSIYAFNQQTGRLVWRQDFHGEAMASPVVVGNTVYEATGGGNLWAFDGATGAVQFKTAMGGFDSMSSANTWTNPKTGSTEVIVGTSDQNNVVAIDAKSGNVLWKQPTALSIFNTGMGDNSAAVDQSAGLVLQDSVVGFNQAAGTVQLAVYEINAASGSVVWSTDIGGGPVPPAYKSGIITIANGVVYVGNPVTSQLYALDEASGKVLWSFQYKNAGPAGAGRGGAVLYHGVLWVASGPEVYAIDPATGNQISSYLPGGRFGIVNPVIVGGTMYLDNSYDWIQAIPLTTIDPAFKL